MISPKSAANHPTFLTRGCTTRKGRTGEVSEDLETRTAGEDAGATALGSLWRGERMDTACTVADRHGCGQAPFE